MRLGQPPGPWLPAWPAALALVCAGLAHAASMAWPFVWGLPGGRVAGLAQIVKAKVAGERAPGGTGTTEL